MDEGDGEGGMKEGVWEWRKGGRVLHGDAEEEGKGRVEGGKGEEGEGKGRGEGGKGEEGGESGLVPAKGHVA